MDPFFFSITPFPAESLFLCRGLFYVLDSFYLRVSLSDIGGMCGGSDTMLRVPIPGHEPIAFLSHVVCSCAAARGCGPRRVRSVLINTLNTISLVRRVPLEVTDTTCTSGRPWETVAFSLFPSEGALAVRAWNWLHVAVRYHRGPKDMETCLYPWSLYFMATILPSISCSDVYYSLWCSALGFS